MTEQSVVQRSAVADFARLSPWSILHFCARTVAQLVSNAFTAVPVLFGLYSTGSLTISMAVLGGAIGLLVLSATLRYLYFSYVVLDASVQVRQGVFSKKQLNLEFRRIQNVNIEHPFYFRPLGLVTLRIDSAGSASEEVFLSALEQERGERIRDVIRANHQSTDVPDSPAVAHAETSTPSSLMLTRASEALPTAAPLTQHVRPVDHQPSLMLNRTLGDLVLHGLTNNRAWIILGALGAAYGQASEQINAFIAGLGIDFAPIVGTSVMALVIIAISGLLFGFMFVAGLSVLGSIVTYYDYELYRSATAFVVRRGLLTRHEINMQKSRIQSVLVRRDWLDMIIGRMNVIFEQISHSQSGQPSATGSDQQILVPSVEPAQCDQLTLEALAAGNLSTFDFTGISLRYLVKLAVITTTCYASVYTAISLAVPDGFLFVFALAPIWVLHMVLLYMSWQRWGLAIDAGMVVIRKGVIGVDHILIPAFKMQEVRRTRTPLMKRHALSSVSFTVASRSVAVPFLPEAFVCEVIDYCLFETERSTGSWM